MGSAIGIREMGVVWQSQVLVFVTAIRKLLLTSLEASMIEAAHKAHFRVDVTLV